MGGRGSDGGVAPGLRFEWDPAKSESNKTKHGVDFTEAQTIWQDPFRVEADSPWVGLEERGLTIGMLNGKLYTVVTTTRGGAIRIISVRRSRRDEEGDYERRRQDDRR